MYESLQKRLNELKRKLISAGVDADAIEQMLSEGTPAPPAELTDPATQLLNPEWANSSSIDPNIAPSSNPCLRVYDITYKGKARRFTAASEDAALHEATALVLSYKEYPNDTRNSEYPKDYIEVRKNLIAKCLTPDVP
jgi:hypothetical protein